MNCTLQASSNESKIFDAGGGTSELTAILSPEHGQSFTEQLEALDRRFSAMLEANGFSRPDVVFVRFFLSDTVAQVSELKGSPLYRSLAVAGISIVGQAPLDGSLVALQVYCLKGDSVAISKPDAGGPTLVKTDGYTFIWSGGLRADGADSKAQTDGIFSDYEATINKHGCQLNPDLVRTWIYVRDVDNNYAGMVEARRDLFQARGLTKDTHYIASTGIEANAPSASDVVTMDALTINGLDEEQIRFLQAPDNMCPTHVYDVTFERGTSIVYGDREHLYVSGTASIDTDGQVMYVGDVTRQTGRTLDNVEALTASRGCGLGDFSHLLIYLRNPSQYDEVKRVVDRRVPATVPRIYLEGPVCRPTWLVEMEGVALKSATAPYPKF